MGLRTETETRRDWTISTEELPPKVEEFPCDSCFQHSPESDECQQIIGMHKALERMGNPFFSEDLKPYFQRILDGPGKRCKNPRRLYYAVKEVTKDLNERLKEFEKGK